MKPELLLKRAMYEPLAAALERDFTVHKLWLEADREGYVRRACANVRAVVTSTSIGFKRAEFEALPKLEIVANFGPYLTLMDLDAARARGVTVSYTPDSTAEPVADLTMGMIVAVMRRLCEADRFVRADRWP